MSAKYEISIVEHVARRVTVIEHDGLTEASMDIASIIDSPEGSRRTVTLHREIDGFNLGPVLRARLELYP